MEIQSLKIDLQPEFLETINETPEQFSKEIKFWAAVSMYCFGKLNINTASAFSGYSHFEFEKLLYELKIPISLFKMINTKNNKQITKKSKRFFGCGKHIIIKIADDFNAPLSEFKEYMP